MNASAVPLPAHALVARTGPDHGAPRDYLRMTPQGEMDWVADPAEATHFDSLREATHVAMCLPSGMRAFGIPAPR